MHVEIESGLMRTRNIIQWLLLCAIFFITENIPAADQHEEDDNRPPVEIGPGGGIKLEKSYRTEAEAQSAWHTHALWESRYVSEGRDNLSGDGLFSLSSEFAIDDVAFVPWLAHSPAADYTELNLNFIYSTFIAQNLAASLGYTHLRFYDQGEDTTDNEVSLDLGYQLLQHLTLSVVIYHSFESDGAFTELVAGYYDEPDPQIHYSVSFMMGANAGYIADGHKGLNYYQLLASVSYIPFTRLELYAGAGYNQAINSDAARYAGDESLNDFSWGGIGIVYLF